MTCDVDVLIVGGGPAGLTAAIYLSRFHLRTIVIDAGSSRAGLIPVSHNHAGFPEGIRGRDLVARMRRQAGQYGAVVKEDKVTSLERQGTGFEAMGTASYRATAVLLATGVTNRRPQMDAGMHDEAVASGRLRYCPICDGYEVSDRRLGVIGTGERGTNEAIFLRGFTNDVSLIAPAGAHDLTSGQQHMLKDAGVAMIGAANLGFMLETDGITVSTDEGHLTFASIYPALGSDIHSELASGLGAKTETIGCIIVDAHQRTSVPGLYAAGDVVLGLDQISHAMGEGGVAATTIRNDLAKVTPLRR